MQGINYMKSRNLISQKETIFSTKEIWPLILEIGILLLQPYPFLHSNYFCFPNTKIKGIRIYGYDSTNHIEYYYYLNDIFALLLSSRVYLVARIILNNSVYRSPRARRLRFSCLNS